MRVNGFVVHGAVTVAVFASGVGAAVSGATGSGVTLAGPKVLRLIQNAPAALSAYPSVTLSLKMTFRDNGHSVSVDESGHMSPDGKSGTFEVALPNGLGTLSGLGIGSTVYLRASQHSVALFGKRWVALNITAAGGAATSTQTPTGNDALSYLQLMPGATGPVQKLGHDTIDGVHTTHYRVTIDLLKAEQQMPAQFEHASAAQLEQYGLSTLPVDVWLDAQNKLRQQKFSFDVQGMAFTSQLRMSGSNAAVQVTAPPASDVQFVTDAREWVQDALPG